MGTTTPNKPTEAINHPQHYGGKDNPYEAIKVIKAWRLGFELGNAVKYICRAGKKDPAKELEDLEKAVWYIQSRIKDLEPEGESRRRGKVDTKPEPLPFGR